MKRIHAAIAAALALAIPTSLAEQAGCSKPKCTVVIVLPADCGSGITVAPNPLVIKSGKPTIEWSVVNNEEWYLGPDGIKIYDDDKAFGSPAFSKEDNKITVVSNGKRNKYYKYDVTLTKKSDNKTKCTVDPTVMN